ncbi:hypothetical protein HYU93_05300 [Candidatus Daviesbacteria bacterium]|nr:hypothetical protein [Candidatus Daviesbacteria bacterium]
MPVQEKERTAVENIPGLRNTSATQFVEFLASLSQETHRIPDPYSYSVTSDGELFSPVGQCLVKDTIDDKISPLGQLEYQAVLAIEQWAANNKEGVSVWISPPKQGVYSASKIIVQEIEYEEGIKKIFNRAIVLDFDEKQCMKLAWNLTSFSSNKPIFRNSDEIRATPLILNTQKKPWIDILEKLIDASTIWTMIRSGEDKQFKKEALRQAAIVQKQFFTDQRLSHSDQAKVAVIQMLGSGSASCPPRSGSRVGTAFQSVAGSAVTISSRGFVESDSKGERTFPCPACGHINERPYEGYVESCQNSNCPNPKAVRC